MPENPVEEITARLNAERAAIERQNQALRDQVERTLSSRPQVLGRQNDFSNPKDIGIVYQWVTENGTLYTRRGVRDRPVSLDQISVLAKRIEQQKGRFDALASEEQDRLRGQFTAAPSSEVVSLYSDLLNSEALGQRYQQLQQGRSTK